MPMEDTRWMRWHFTGSIWRTGIFGNAVQVNQYPAKSLMRDRENWGWIMENMWVLYTSFPMPLVDPGLYSNDDLGVGSYGIDNAWSEDSQAWPWGNELSILNEDGSVDIEMMKRELGEVQKRFKFLKDFFDNLR